MRFFLCAFALLLSTTVAQAGGGTAPLSWEPVRIGATPSAVGPLTISVDQPNDASHPTVWDGPIHVKDSRRASSCVVNASLITAVYVSPEASSLMVLSYSGSTRSVEFWSLRPCKKTKSLSGFSEGVELRGDRLVMNPGCECSAPDEACSCSAGRVYLAVPGKSPKLLPSESRALTRKVLGVGFTGNGKVLHPKSPQAKLSPGD